MNKIGRKRNKIIEKTCQIIFMIHFNLQNILSVQDIYHYFTFGQQMVNDIYTSQIYITVACTSLHY